MCQPIRNTSDCDFGEKRTENGRNNVNTGKPTGEKRTQQKQGQMKQIQRQRQKQKLSMDLPASAGVASARRVVSGAFETDGWELYGSKQPSTTHNPLMMS